MKTETKKRFVRLVLFGLCLLAAIVLSDIFLIQTDTFCALNMREMQERSDIELALVGSSIVRDHFNNEIISRETGKTSFSIAIPSASLQANLASTKELFETNSPEWVVLVTEPYGFVTAKEDTETAYRLIPFIKNPQTLAKYFFQSAAEDGNYINRLLLFREFGTETLDQVLKTFGLRYNTWETYEKIKDTLDPSAVYQGSGFVRHAASSRVDDLIRQTMIPEYSEYWDYPDYYYDLLEPSKSMLMEYKELVESHGAKLLVVMYPNMTAHALNEPEFLPYNDCLMRFCAQKGIPCYNFLFARPELLPRLDGYYYDLYHMHGEGADILSEAFARFFNLYTAGEDVSNLFYADRQEYLNAIDFITNVWIEEDEEKSGYTVDCNRGPLVVPEYQFVLREKDGTETLIRDFSTESTLTDPVNIPDGGDLRVYARPSGQTDTVYYDYPTDWIAYTLRNATDD